MTVERRMGKILDILKAFRREWTIGETLKRLESEIIKPATEAEREACVALMREISTGFDRSNQPCCADAIRCTADEVARARFDNPL